MDLPVPADYIVQVQAPGLLEGGGEREGGVEVGEGAVDEADAAEGVRGCEVGGGEGGDVDAEAAGGVEVEEGWREGG